MSTHGLLWSLPARMPKKRQSTGAPRKQPERSLQTRVATMLSWMLPPEVPWSSIAHGVYIPGDENVAKRIGARLKASGLHRGWPDLILLWRGQSAFIEMKSKSGSLSPEQREVHAKIKLAGGVVRVCKSEDEVVAFLADLGIEMRARLSPAERAMADRR